MHRRHATCPPPRTDRFSVFCIFARSPHVRFLAAGSSLLFLRHPHASRHQRFQSDTEDTTPHYHEPRSPDDRRRPGCIRPWSLAIVPLRPTSSLAPQIFPCSRYSAPVAPSVVAAPSSRPPLGPLARNGGRTRGSSPLASASSRSSLWTAHPCRPVHPPAEVGVPTVIQRFTVELRLLHLHSIGTCSQSSRPHKFNKQWVNNLHANAWLFSISCATYLVQSCSPFSNRFELSDKWRLEYH
jgi:hypothetical protein